MFRTMHACENMKFISRVEQDNSLDILVSTRNKFHISAYPCIILYLNIEHLIQPKSIMSCEISRKPQRLKVSHEHPKGSSVFSLQTPD